MKPIALAEQRGREITSQTPSSSRVWWQRNLETGTFGNVKLLFHRTHHEHDFKAVKQVVDVNTTNLKWEGKSPKEAEVIPYGFER